MTARRQNDDWQCPEAISHGPATRDGRCPWCHRKINSKFPRNRAEIRARNLAEQDPLRIEPDPDEDYWGH